MTFTTFSTKQDGATLHVILNNGEVNMMTATMAGELFALLGQLAVDAQTKIVVFESANSNFFIAHFDIDDIFKVIEGDPSIPVSKTKDLNVLQALGLSISNLPQVTIAKVDGICRGGGFEFMLALDMCFATADSKFCFPEVSCGFLPAGGGTTLLPLKAGSARALEIMLTGRDFSGEEAQEYNVINRAFRNSSELDNYVSEAVQRISRNNAAANQAVKSVLKHTFSGMTEGVLAGLAQENASMNECLADPAVLAQLKLLAENSGTRDKELDLPATIASF